MAQIEADDKNLEGEEPTGSRKKLLLIIGIAVVLLIGSGVAAFFLLRGDEAPGDGETAEQAEAAAEPEGEPIYHAMRPTFVVNLAPGGRARMLQVAVQVYTRQPAMVELLQKHDPMLRSSLLDVFSAHSSDDLMTPDGRERLRAEVKADLEQRLAATGAEISIAGVYFTQFVLQ